ncbi:SIMPL domain-containing protein [Dermacoccaceae bacterium W4C1]
MDIDVTGTATLTHPPERGTLSVLVSAEGPDKDRAWSAVTASAGKVQSAAKELLGAEPAPVTEVLTLPVRTRSWRPTSEAGQVLPVQHRVESTLRITFTDLVALSRFSDEWGGVEGVGMAGVDWDLESGTRERLEREALTAAYGSALTQASVLADAAGAGTPRVVRIDATDERIRPRAVRMMAMDAGDSGLELAPEEIDVTARLSARFTA